MDDGRLAPGPKGHYIHADCWPPTVNTSHRHWLPDVLHEYDCSFPFTTLKDAYLCRGSCFCFAALFLHLIVAHLRNLSAIAFDSTPKIFGLEQWYLGRTCQATSSPHEPGDDGNNAFRSAVGWSGNKLGFLDVPIKNVPSLVGRVPTSHGLKVSRWLFKPRLKLVNTFSLPD